MPSYNSARFISASIESIIAQTFQDWELLIADDCSTDNSCAIIENYSKRDNRIKLFQLTQNQGAAVARNHSILQAQGRYIAFCDSDDLWMPNKLERQIEFMKKNNVEICFSSYIECDEQGNNLGIVVAPRSTMFRDMIKCDYMGFLTLIYDTNRIGKMIIPNLRKRQDWALKIKLMQRVEKAVSIMEPLAYYRIRGNSISRNKFDLIKYNVQVYKDVLNYNFIKAWSLFLFRFMPSYIIKTIKYRITNI